jgi:hypothetical protein
MFSLLLAFVRICILGNALNVGVNFHPLNQLFLTMTAVIVELIAALEMSKTRISLAA